MFDLSFNRHNSCPIRKNTNSKILFLKIGLAQLKYVLSEKTSQSDSD